MNHNVSMQRAALSQLGAQTTRGAQSDQNAAIPSAPEKPIPMQMNRQDSLICSLHGLISDLESRLDSVTESRPPRAEVAEKTQAPRGLHESLMFYNNQIESACSRIADLRERLQF